MKIGEHVTYHYWHAGELTGYDAVVTGVFEQEPIVARDEKGNESVIGFWPQLALEVAFSEEVIASGIITSQSCSRQRTRIEDDVHTSGTWSPLS
jgi:hypothetical protein